MPRALRTLLAVRTLAVIAILVVACGERGAPPGSTSGSTPGSTAGSAVVPSGSDVADAIHFTSTSGSGTASPAAVIASASSSADPGDPTVDVLPTGTDYEVHDEAGLILGALGQPTWVVENPRPDAKKLGYLHAGMTVPRSARPVTTAKCKGGWYRVAPRGFVCANHETTLDPEHPIVKAYMPGAARGEPLPFRYGRVKGNPPLLYARLPTRHDQLEGEGKELSEYMAKNANTAAMFDRIEPVPDFLTDGKILPKPFNMAHRTRHGAHRGPANARGSFAFLRGFVSQGRLFGLTTELDLVAIDRVRLATASAFHGGEVTDLPAMFLHRGAVPRLMRDDKGQLAVSGAFDGYRAVTLTGQVRDDMNETSDGAWLPSRSGMLFHKRTSWPAFAKDGDTMKWLDISIHDQTLIAYEGRRAVFVTRISSGGGGEDPDNETSTPKGFYKVQTKHLSATMTGDQVENDYELQDVPYVQYFQGGYALHAAFWHEKFGTPVSHGCINLSPRDAAWMFEWTLPEVPTQWHGAEAHGEGTLLYIH